MFYRGGPLGASMLLHRPGLFGCLKLYSSLLAPFEHFAVLWLQYPALAFLFALFHNVADQACLVAGIGACQTNSIQL